MSKVFLQHAAKLGIIADIAAAVTIGDEANIAMLNEHGVRFVEVPNMPLGAKHNAALSLSMAMGGQRFMVLPSDDLISAEWLAVFKGSDEPYVSPDRCAIVDVPTGAAKVITNRPSGNRNFGAGRFFGIEVVHALGCKVWDDDRVSGLDTNSHGRIVMAGFPGRVHRCDAVPICDLKTGNNIWPFGQWKGDAIGIDEALGMCDAETRALIAALGAW